MPEILRSRSAVLKPPCCPRDTAAQVLEILKQPEWRDFGPTFAAEQLAKRHRIRVSDERCATG